MRDYDFAYEGQYFNMKRAEVKVYGAKPCGGMPTPVSALEAR
jgi:hypothetical protein